LSQQVIEDSIANTLEVADKIEDYTGILGQSRIPDFPIPPEFNEDAGAYMGHVAREGLVKRMKGSQLWEIDQEYRDRLEYEIEMMIQMGFPTYFLVVWDYIRFARDNNIPVGPGRGSAAGLWWPTPWKSPTLTPSTTGLLFERFFNPERKSMPDIDTDFCIDRRDEVIKYVTRRYGEERVAQIITFNRMTSKAVLKDVARVLDIPYAESDRMAKLIPVARGKPTKLKVMISDDTPAPEFKEKYDNDPQTRRWIDMALRIEGTNKTFGMHAAGVVISKDPLDEIVPLQRNNDGQVITQYYMEDVEALGLLKMDFLGLRNLTMIQKTLELIEATHGTKIDPDDLPMDDPATYKLLERGDLGGVFQLESSGMRQIVKDLKPSGLEDIPQCWPLPTGAAGCGADSQIHQPQARARKIDFADEILKPILSETYGIMVYQEQIMKIAQDMGGYSLGPSRPTAAGHG
jgi:DNA polymerase-3 subunit alpha